MKSSNEPSTSNKVNNAQNEDEEAAYYSRLEECDFPSLASYVVYLPFLTEIKEKCREQQTECLKSLIKIITNPAKIQKPDAVVHIRLILEKLKFHFKATWNTFLRSTKSSWKPMSCSSINSTHTITAPSTVTTVSSKTTESKICSTKEAGGSRDAFQKDFSYSHHHHSKDEKQQEWQPRTPSSNHLPRQHISFSSVDTNGKSKDLRLRLDEKRRIQSNRRKRIAFDKERQASMSKRDHLESSHGRSVINEERQASTCEWDLLESSHGRSTDINEERRASTCEWDLLESSHGRSTDINEERQASMSKWDHLESSHRRSVINEERRASTCEWDLLESSHGRSTDINEERRASTCEWDLLESSHGRSTDINEERQASMSEWDHLESSHGRSSVINKERQPSMSKYDRLESSHGRSTVINEHRPEKKPKLDESVRLESFQRRPTGFKEKITSNQLTEDFVSESKIKKLENNIQFLINQKQKNSATFQNITNRNLPMNEEQMNFKLPEITLQEESSNRKPEDYTDIFSSSNVIMKKQIANKITSHRPNPEVETSCETKPIVYPVENESPLTSVFDEMMAPVREKNMKPRGINILVNKPSSTVEKRELVSEEKQILPKPVQKDSEQHLKSMELMKNIAFDTTELGPIIDKVVSEYNKIKHSTCGLSTPLEPVDVNMDLASNNLPVCPSKAENVLKAQKGNIGSTLHVNSDHPLIPQNLELSTSSTKNTSKKPNPLSNEQKTEYNAVQNSCEKISSKEESNKKFNKTNPEEAVSISPKSVIEMAEEDIIKRPFLKKIPTLPFLNNSDSDEENDPLKNLSKGQQATGQEIIPDQSTTGPTNKPQLIPSISNASPSSTSVTKSIKSRLSKEISTFHKVGSPYGGSLRTLKSDIVPARRMASLKAGAIMDLLNEDKKPYRATVKSKNNLQPNTNFDLSSNVSENKPKAALNLKQISQEELKKIVEKNLFDLPDPPNINFLNNNIGNEIVGNITPNQSGFWSNSSTSALRPVAGSTSVNIINSTNLPQTRTFSYPGNVLPDKNINSSHLTFTEPNCAYIPPVLQNDPFRSPCYDGSSTPDPYRQDPYTLNLSHNMSSNNILNSPVYQSRTPILDVPSSPFAQFDNHPSCSNHLSERDNVHRNASLGHHMLALESNNAQRSQLGPHPISYDRGHYNQMMRSSPMPYGMGTVYNVQNNMYTRPTPSTYAAWKAEKFAINSKVQQQNNSYRWSQPMNMHNESVNDRAKEDDLTKRENDMKKLSVRDPRRRSIEEPTKTEKEPDIYERDPRKRKKSPPVERGRSIERRPPFVSQDGNMEIKISPSNKRRRSIERKRSPSDRRGRNVERKRSPSVGQNRSTESKRSSFERGRSVERKMSRDRNYIRDRSKSSDRHSSRARNGHSNPSDKRRDYSSERVPNRSGSKAPHKRGRSPNDKDRFYYNSYKSVSPTLSDLKSDSENTNTNSPLKYRIPKINKAETDPAQNIEEKISDRSDLSSTDTIVKDENQPNEFICKTKLTTEVNSPKIDNISNRDGIDLVGSNQPQKIISENNLLGESDKTGTIVDVKDVAADEFTSVSVEKITVSDKIIAQPGDECDTNIALPSELDVDSYVTKKSNLGAQGSVCASKNPDELPEETMKQMLDDQISDVHYQSSSFKNSNSNSLMVESGHTTEMKTPEGTEIVDIKESNVETSDSIRQELNTCKNEEVKGDTEQHAQPSVSNNDLINARDILVPNVQTLKSIFGVVLTDDKIKSLQEILKSCQPEGIEKSSANSASTDPTNETPDHEIETNVVKTDQDPLPIQREHLISSGSIDDENITDSESLCGKGQLISNKSKSGYKKKLKGKLSISMKPKSVPKKVRKKFKNELDKLQDDISKYHDSEAIAAASGPRKCRLQKATSTETQTSVQASLSVSTKQKGKKDILKKITNSNKRKRSPSPKYNSDSSDSDSLVALTEKMKAKYEPMILESEAKLKQKQESENKIINVVRKDSNLNEVADVQKEAVAEEKMYSFLPANQCNNQNMKSTNFQDPVGSDYPHSLEGQDNSLQKSMAKSANNNKGFDHQDVPVIMKIKLAGNESDFSGLNTNSKKQKKQKCWSSGMIKKKPKQKKSDLTMKLACVETGNATPPEEPDNLDYQEEEPAFETNLADLNYFQDGDLNPINCKLCSYKGKHIVSHYTISHPKDEVVISRMSPEVAKLAIKESNLFFQKGIVKSSKLTCRFCRQDFVKPLVFFEHLALHSGEFRHECCKCGYRTSTRGGIVKHFNSVHENLNKVNCRVLYKEPSDKTHLIGYLCSICNFFQLSDANVLRHLILSHDKLDASYRVKINCSLLNYDDSDYDSSEVNQDSTSQDEDNSTIPNSDGTEKNAGPIENSANADSTKTADSTSNIDSTKTTECTDPIGNWDNTETSTNTDFAITSEIDESHESRMPDEENVDTEEVSNADPVMIEQSKDSVTSILPSISSKIYEPPKSRTSDEEDVEDVEDVDTGDVSEQTQQPPVLDTDGKSQGSENSFSGEPEVPLFELDPSFTIKQEEVDIIDVAVNCEQIGCFEPTEDAIDLNSLDEQFKEIYKKQSDEVLASIQAMKNTKHDSNVIKTINSKLSDAQSEGSSTLCLKDLIKEKFTHLKKFNIEHMPSVEPERTDVDSPVRRQQLERSCKLQKLNSESSLETETGDLDMTYLFKDIGEPFMENNAEDFNNFTVSESQNGNGLSLFKNQIERCQQSIKKQVRTEPKFEVYKFPSPANLNTSEFTYVMQKIAHLNVKPSEKLEEIIVGGFKVKNLGDTMLYSCQLKIFNKLCDFSTTVLNDFGSHVNLSHQNCYWDAICGTCFTVFIEDPTKKTSIHFQNFAFCHLVVEHLSFDTLDGTFSSTKKDKGSATVTQVTEAVSSPFRIRVRRLSGDKLSTPGPSTQNSLFRGEAVASVAPLPIRFLHCIPTSADLALKIQLQEYFKMDLVSKALSVCKERISASKSLTALTSMLQESKLRQYFKCMGYNCSFTSLFFPDFALHLDQHRKIHQLCPNDDPHKGLWKICAYCGEQKSTNCDFGEHLRSQHGESTLQCSKCFYRAKNIANVEHHYTLEHPNDVLRVLECHDTENFVRAKIPEKHFTFHAPPLKCTKGDCNLFTYMLERYIGHMLQTHSSDDFECYICSWSTTKVIPLLEHLREQHHIGVYQCMWCQYGCHTEFEMKTHLCYVHPAEYPKSISRIQCEQKPGVNQELMKRNIYHKDQAKFIKYTIPEPASSLKATLPKTYILKRSEQVEITTSIQIIPSSLVSTVQSVGTTRSITMVRSLNPQAVSTAVPQLSPRSLGVLKCVETVRPFSASPLKLRTLAVRVPSIPALAIQGPSTHNSKPLAICAPTAPPVANANPSFTLAVRPLNVQGLSTQTSKSLFIHVPSTKMSRPLQISNVEPNSIKATPSPEQITIHSSAESGVVSSDVVANLLPLQEEDKVDENYFKCGNKNCDFDTSSSSQLRDHLVICDLARQSQRLTCVYCNRGFKVPGSLIEHLRKHGPPRFSCSMCNFKDPLREKVLNHHKTAHQIFESVCDPCNINLTNMEKDYFIVRPKNKGQNQTKPHPTKAKRLQKNKKKFSPEELDCIPKAAVFQQPLGCALCQYTTKVRSNLVRHMNQHETGSMVTPQDVVNPVPEKAEKMFDKMMNLAGSSHKRRDDEEEDLTCPFKYVSDKVRYKCHVENCGYITLKDSFLQTHIMIIHKDETNYVCPHCDETPTSMPIDQLMVHLKLHDCPLFKCSHCRFYSPMRNSIERHQQLSHPGVNSLAVNTVRNVRPDQSVAIPGAGPSLPTLTPTEGQEEEWYACSSCSFRSKTKKMILNHLSTKHKQEKPIRCPLCTHESVTGKAFRSHYTTAHRNEPSLDPIVMYSKVKETKQPPLIPILPLWKRNNNKIKFIRGIVLDERGDAPPPVLTCPSQDVQLLDVLELKYGRYGYIRQNNMVCPRCPGGFVTRNKQDMKEHLFKDLSYKPISCTICKFDGVCKKKIEKHIQKYHNVDLLEVAQYLETKEDREKEEWVQNVITKQQSQMKMITSDNEDEESDSKKRGRKSSLEDAIPPRDTADTDPLAPVDTPVFPDYTNDPLAMYLDDTDISSQEDHLSQDETWEPDRDTRLDTTSNRKSILRNRYQCNHCDVTTKFNTSLAIHYNNAHPDKSTKLIDDSQELKAEGYCCVHCNLLAFYMLDLKTHWSVTHKISGLNFMIKRKSVHCNLEYQCYLCKKLGNVFTLEEHFIVFHPDQSFLLVPVAVPKYKCSECKLVFNSIDILNRHFAMDHPNKDFCFLVVSSQKSFPTPSPESNSKLSVMTYKCFTCHFVNPNYKPTVKHVRRHFTTYQCRQCDTLFPTTFSIRSHMNSKHPGVDTKPLILNGSEEDVEKAKRNIVVVCENGKKRKITEEEILRGESEDDTPKESSKFIVLDEIKKPSPANSPVKETARKSTGSPRKPLLNPENKSSPPKMKFGLKKNSPKVKRKKKFTLSNFSVEVHSRGKKIKFRASTLEQILDLNAKLSLKPVNSDNERT